MNGITFRGDLKLPIISYCAVHKYKVMQDIENAQECTAAPAFNYNGGAI